MTTTPLLAAFAATAALLVPASAAQASPVAACSNGDVTASYRQTDAGMSHTYGRLVLTNTSDAACSLRGYGGLSYVGGAKGRQVGAAADRTPSKVRTVVLAPGEKAVSIVAATDTAPYSAKKCRPVHVKGFRVYVPNQTQAQFVAFATTGCRNPAVHLLQHKAYRAVK